MKFIDGKGKLSGVVAVAGEVRGKPVQGLMVKRPSGLIVPATVELNQGVTVAVPDSRRTADQRLMDRIKATRNRR